MLCNLVVAVAGTPQAGDNVAEDSLIDMVPKEARSGGGSLRCDE